MAKATKKPATKSEVKPTVKPVEKKEVVVENVKPVEPVAEIVEDIKPAAEIIEDVKPEVVVEPVTAKEVEEEAAFIEEKEVPTKEKKGAKEESGKGVDAKKRIAEYLKTGISNDNIQQRVRGGAFISQRTGVIYVPITIFE